MYQSNRVSLSSANMQGYLSSGGSSGFSVNDYGNRTLPRDDGMNSRGVIVEPFQPMARTISTHPNYHGAMEDERLLIPENSAGIWHENGYDRAGQFYEGGRKRKSSDDIAGYRNQLWPHVANWESGTSSRHLDFERHEMCNGSVYDVPTMRPIAGPERGDFITHRPFPPVESSMAAEYRSSALSARGRFEGPQRSERNMVHLNHHLESGFPPLGSHSGHFLVRSSLESSADMERRSSFPRERIDNMARDGGFFNSFPPERDWAASVHREGAPIISNPRGSSHNLYPSVSNNGMSYAPVHWNHHQRLHMSSRESTQTFLSGHRSNFSHLPVPLASQVDAVFNPSVDSVGYQYHDHRRSSSVDHHNEHDARSVRRMLDIPIARFHALRAEDGLHDRPVPEDAFLFDRPTFYGSLDVYDRYREMRLDVDNMSYEELLALEERIGNVSTGLTEDTVSNCMKMKKFSAASDSSSEEASHKCSICQEEYKDDEEIGTLECGHDHHTECIKQWLLQKNECPICKKPALKA